ncbi:MAG: bifunctional [glutamate--ammonia ligase]-adenylyl-L-tyrosine phosphorylase/[glutamate--ammonia-ligase] adenylyltransferase [Moraxella sp.]
MPNLFSATPEKLEKLALASPFAKSIFDKDPAAACDFLSEFSLSRPLNQSDFDSTLWQGQNLTNHENLFDNSEADIAKYLRQKRTYFMLKWIWQDALEMICLEQLTFELSAFANSCIKFCKDYTYHTLCKRYGEPVIKKNGKTLNDEFAVVAMGKLGAMELNLSSDIDLIFLHLADGETNGKKIIDNQKFMINLGRGMIRLLSEVSEFGFVFRVDMRLRPWGDGSPLVMTLPALQKYFSQHGRTWERFAWLKARLVNWVGDEFYETFSQIRKTFVYRYYVDYTAFSALREMKTLIMNQQAQRQDLDNIKLGMGGIRDIEFIVQAFALIYGGHHASIGQNRACLDFLYQLHHFGYFNDEEYQNLSKAYRFLRRLEHAIQARHDEQSQRLPKDDAERLAIANTLGFSNIDDFYQILNHHRKNVSIPFERMINKRQTLDKNEIDLEKDLQTLDELIGQEIAKPLTTFLQSKLVLSLDNEPKSRLKNAYPLLIHALVSYAQKDGEKAGVTVPRLLELLEAICRRSVYLVMIAENPKATLGLIPILSASPWIAKELVLYPMLLDDFLQKRYLHLPDKQELTDILRQSLLRIEAFDDESYLGAVRVFKKTQVLSVATADILGLRHIMKVSDSLTFIAEVVLQSALFRAFDELTQKYGFPKLLDGKATNHENMGFAIIGYGKLGGIEMSYASDLDVVFLHNIDEKADTTGEKSVSGMKFASRMVQKIINYLTTQTRDGRAYELDMRLRPSGNAGVMVVSLHAFETYQKQKAWSWEHQALVRARGVAGDKVVLTEFNRIRQEVLVQARQIQQVQMDVLSMRQKMQSHLGTDEKNHQFHLKQDMGGLVDIEFLAQFMVLAYAYQYPNLAIWSDNVRIFEEVAKTGLWQEKCCQDLTNAYLTLRQKTHELALLDKKIIVEDDQWQQLRSFVKEIWQKVIVGKR